MNDNYTIDDVAEAFNEGYEDAIADIHQLILEWDGDFTPAEVIQTLEDLIAWKGFDSEDDIDY